MASTKEITYRMLNKFQVKFEEKPVVNGCTTFYELDNMLHAIISSVEGDFTSLYRMRTIKTTKDVDKIYTNDLPGLTKITDIDGTYNGKSFPIRFGKDFKYDDVSAFSSSISFGGEYVKNKVESNKAIVSSPKSSGSGISYPVTKLSKSNNHFLMFQKKLSNISTVRECVYSSEFPSETMALDSLTERASFSIAYVWRKYKAVIDRVTKKPNVADEAFIGVYQLTSEFDLERTTSLKLITRNKVTGAETVSYKAVSIPLALDYFNIQATSNDIIAVINSKLDIFVNKTTDENNDYDNEEVIMSKMPSLFFYHNISKPYNSYFDDKKPINKKYYKQEFTDFCDGNMILGSNFEVKVLDTKSYPSKPSVPIIAISGPALHSPVVYTRPGYFSSSLSYSGTLKYYRYPGVYDGAYGTWRNDYTRTINFGRQTMFSQLKIFAYQKGVKPHELVISPGKNIFAMWDRKREGYTSQLSALGLQPSAASEPTTKSSTIESMGFIKHAPFYQFDMVLSPDKRKLYVLSVMADAYIMPYKAFWMHGTGMAKVIGKHFRNEKELTSLVASRLLKTIIPIDLNPQVVEPLSGSRYIGANYYYPDQEWLYPSPLKGTGSQSGISYIPAELPSRKLYVDILDISGLPGTIKSSTTSFQGGKLWSLANMALNKYTGLISPTLINEDSVGFGNEDVESLNKIIDFKVVYNKKRPFVIILKAQWSGKAYANCIGAISLTDDRRLKKIAEARDFTLNYPDAAWIEVWEMDLRTNTFGSIDITTRKWKENVPNTIIKIGINNDYPLPIIHEEKNGSAIAGNGTTELYGPTLDKCSTLEDFSKYKGEFIQGVFTSSGLLILYCPHNKYGKNILLNTTALVDGSVTYDLGWKEVDKSTNYLFIVENIK